MELAVHNSCLVEPADATSRSRSMYLDWPAAASCLPSTRDAKLEREVVRFARATPELLFRLRAAPLVLSRQVAASTLETARFFAIAQALGRPALIMMMPDDRFTPAINPWKRAIAKLTVQTRHHVRYVTVVDFAEVAGLPFRNMQCLDGTPFVEFHLQLLELSYGAMARAAAIDATEFFRATEGTERYERFFSLFTCFAHLAESYIPTGYEQPLFETTIWPAYQATIARFGRRPRIVRLLPEGDELNSVWDRFQPLVLSRALQAAGRARAAAKVSL